MDFKRFISLWFLLLPLLVFGQPYHISPTGDDDTGNGSIGSPWLTLEKASNNVLAGDTVYCRGGTYDITYTWPTFTNLHGTSSNYIHFRAYPGETPVFDCNNMPEYGARRGLTMNDCSYVKFYGLHWKNLSIGGVTTVASGIYMSGDMNNIWWEYCSVSNVHGHGWHYWEGVNGVADTVYFINCDSYDNQYPGGGTTACDGFNMGITTSTDYLYNSGCRAWGNSDDAWDNAGSNSKGFIEYYDCWAFGTVNGDGNGFKMVTWGGSDGYDQEPLLRKYVRCLSVYNEASGFHENEYSAIINANIYNCIAYGNGSYGFYVPTTGVTFPDNESIYKNNIAYNNSITDHQSNYNKEIDAYNSWNTPPGVTITDADFAYLPDSATIVDTLKSARQADGSLPDIGNLFHLASTSDLIDAGTDVGLSYEGTAPDLGAFEYTEETPSPTGTKLRFTKPIYYNGKRLIIE